MFDLFTSMPEQAATWSADVDWLNDLITNLSVFFTVTLTGAMIYLGVKYRKKSEDQEVAYITHNAMLETVWTVVPTIICAVMFVYGIISYKEMRTPPSSAIEINVDAYSWRWDFTYPGGKKSTNTLVVPLGQPIRLIMTSHDVIHSFFIPAMRVKEDVYQGNYSYLWFEPIKLGEFHIFCAEYCGLQHSAMIGKVKVVTQEEYEDYLVDRKAGDAPQLSPAEAGKVLYTEKTCNTCHSLDGSQTLGPSFKGLFASKERKLADGTVVPIDENYIRESILQPQAKMVEGFSPIMPAFEGQLSEEDIANLIAYLKTL